MQQTLVVLVRYSIDVDISIVKNIFHDCHIFEIWTNPKVNMCNAHINEAFEFSGYQFGLKTIMDKFDKEDFYKIIFVNDTAFQSHVSIFTKFLLKKMKHNMSTLDDHRLIGIQANIPSNCADNCVIPERYLSTWLFMMTGRGIDFANFKFYNNETLEFFQKDLLNTKLSSDYIQYVYLWLNPKSIFKGWYKSLPKYPLDMETLRRKKFTIYLEHTLALRNIGVRQQNIADNLSIFDNIIFNILKFCDRVYTIFQKLRYRISVDKGGR